MSEQAIKENFAPAASPEEEYDAIEASAAQAYAPPPTPEVAYTTASTTASDSSATPSSKQGQAPTGDQGAGTGATGSDTSTEQGTEGEGAPDRASREEAEKVIKTLLADAAAGKWSEDSLKAWEKLFKELSGLPGATPESVARTINELGAALNKKLEEAGSPNRIGMAIQQSPDGTSSIYMTLKGPGIDPADRLTALLSGKNTDTVIKIGTMKG